MPLTSILLGALLPACLAGALLLLLRGLSRPRQGLDPASGLALAAGVAAGQWAIVGLPSFPPVDVTHWLPYLASLGGLLGLALSLAGWAGKPAAHLALASMAWAGLLPVLLKPMLEYRWEGAQAYLWVGLTWVLSVLLWTETAALARRRRGAGPPMLVLLLALTAGVCLVLGRSALLGQLAGAVASAWAAALALSWLFARQATWSLLVPFAALSSTLLLLGGYFFAQVPAFTALALALSPASARLADLFSRRGGWLALAAPLICMASALAWAVWVSESGAYYDEYGVD